MTFCRGQSQEYFFLDPALNQVRRLTTPILPTSMDFDIPAKYTRTINDQRFLLADRIRLVNKETVTRIIIFATDEQLRILFTSPHILMDGTFDSAPSHFNQIYSIHAVQNDQSKDQFQHLESSHLLLNCFRFRLRHRLTIWSISNDL